LANKAGLKNRFMKKRNPDWSRALLFPIENFLKRVFLHRVQSRKISPSAKTDLAAMKNALPGFPAIQRNPFGNQERKVFQMNERTLPGENLSSAGIRQMKKNLSAKGIRAMKTAGFLIAISHGLAGLGRPKENLSAKGIRAMKTAGFLIAISHGSAGLGRPKKNLSTKNFRERKAVNHFLKNSTGAR